MAQCRNISFDEAKHLLDTVPGAVLLDVRDPDEYELSHALGARLLPVDSITTESAAALLPDPDAPVLVYCKTGIRSEKAAEKLLALGYTQLYDIGSLIGWPYGLDYD